MPSMSDHEQTPDTTESDSSYRKLLAVTQRRLEKFVSLFAKLLVSDHPDTIHDTRVWSRRLQEAFRVLFPQPRIGKSRKLVRTLRQVRRALGDCRNIDVTLALIDNKLTAATAASAHESWDLVRDYLREKQERLVAQARDELTRHDITQFVTRTQSLLEPDGLAQEPEELLKQSVEKALADWNEALRDVKENPEVDQIHALRISRQAITLPGRVAGGFGRCLCQTPDQILEVASGRAGQLA